MSSRLPICTVYNLWNRISFIPQSLSWYHKRFAPATVLSQTLAAADSIAGHLTTHRRAPCQAFHLPPQTLSLAPCSPAADPIAGHLSLLRSSLAADLSSPLAIVIRSLATLAIVIHSPALCRSARSHSVRQLLQRSIQSQPAPRRSVALAPSCCPVAKLEQMVGGA
jgi:hypothetical protein